MGVKSIRLLPSVFQIALIAAVVAALTNALLNLGWGTGANVLLTAGIVFMVVFLVVFFAARLLVTKFHYSQLRNLYNTILQFSIQVKGANTIPKKIADASLIHEIVRLVRDLETSDKEEIVHLKELEVFRKEFLGNVSHELKTPDTSNKAYGQVLQRIFQKKGRNDGSGTIGKNGCADK